MPFRPRERGFERACAALDGAAVGQNWGNSDGPAGPLALATEPDLAAVATAWSGLPQAVHASIVAMVAAARTKQAASS